MYFVILIFIYLQMYFWACMVKSPTSKGKNTFGRIQKLAKVAPFALVGKSTITLKFFQ